MKQIQLTKQQQVEIGKRMNDELERVTMSWDNTLREWYPIAIKALDFASAMSLGIPQRKFVNLFREDTHGINMNVVMILANNIEARTPTEMGVTAAKWSEILLMNDAIATNWRNLMLPIQKKVIKEVEIMNGRAGLVIAEA